jgi:hypothetical protein
MVSKPPEACGVGYKHPPLTTRFQPGQSGNPSGRPRRPKGFSSDLNEVLSETTRVRVGTQDIHVTKQRAIVMALVQAALDRDAKAISLLITHFTRFNTAEGDDEQGDAPTLDELELLKDYVRREEKRRSANRAEPKNAANDSTQEGGDR